MKAFGIDPAAPAARAPFQGTFHRLYEIPARGAPPRLLRVAALEGAGPAGLMALEARVSTELAARGLPIPACEARTVAGRGVQVVERAAGESMAAFDDDEPRTLAALGDVARFLAALHRIRGDGYGPLSSRSGLHGVHASWPAYVLLNLDRHLDACVSIGAISTDEAARIANAFEAARPLLDAQAPALLHGDPGSHNFIVDASGIRAVIDWEDALLGDPLFDLAGLCTFHPERRHAAIGSAYGAELASRSEAWRRFWLYFLRISLAKTVHRHRFGYADRPGRAPAARRIQLALERLGEAA